MTYLNSFQQILSGTATDTANTTVASFDFATGNDGGTNLDNAVVTIKSVILIRNSDFSSGAFVRLDCVASRLFSTLNMIQQINGFGDGAFTIRNGNSPVNDFLGFIGYVVSGTQIQLQIQTGTGIGTVFFGGIMSGFCEA